MFTAPAKDIIVATSNGGYQADGKFVSGDYVTGDGTSMSAAIASGTFALLKQKYPDYTPASWSTVSSSPRTSPRASTSRSSRTNTTATAT